MWKKWFEKAATPSKAAEGGATLARPLDGVDRSLAVEFLCRARSILPMTPRQAETAAGFMVARQYAAGAVVFKEGDSISSRHMLWILHGEATIEAMAANPRDAITLTVLEPGSTLGEMGVLDGRRRSTGCTACSTLRCALLTRDALQALAAQHPEVAAKLLAIVCMGMASRLREVTEKHKRHVMVTNMINDEHSEAMPAAPAL